jgi:hypothetical protein
MTDRAQRKRRAVIGAIALLEWRNRMAEEDARNRMTREDADREMVMKYQLMVAEMRRQAEEFSWRKPATPSPFQSVSLPACHGTGHCGAL